MLTLRKGLQHSSSVRAEVYARLPSPRCERLQIADVPPRSDGSDVGDLHERPGHLDLDLQFVEAPGGQRLLTEKPGSRVSTHVRTSTKRERKGKVRTLQMALTRDMVRRNCRT
jgi:hypothetical protein